MLEETPGMTLDYVLPNSVTHSPAQTLPTNQSERPDFPAPEEACREETQSAWLRGQFYV